MVSVAGHSNDSAKVLACQLWRFGDAQPFPGSGHPEFIYLNGRIGAVDSGSARPCFPSVPAVLMVTSRFSDADAAWIANGGFKQPGSWAQDGFIRRD